MAASCNSFLYSRDPACGSPQQVDLFWTIAPPPHESPVPSLGWRKRPVPLGQAYAEAVSGNLQIEWAEISYHFIQIQSLKCYNTPPNYHFLFTSEAL